MVAARPSEQGVRALDGLRDGVERAIKALGAGFLTTPPTPSCARSCATARLDTQDYYRQLLRLVYRLLFLFVAEDRGLLLDPAASEAAAQTLHRATTPPSACATWPSAAAAPPRRPLSRACAW